MPSWWLTLDGIGGSYTALTEPRSTTIFAAQLAAVHQRDGTTVWLAYEEVVASRLQEWSRDGQLLTDHPIDPVRGVTTGLPFDRREGVLAVGEGAIGRLVPTFLVASGADDGEALAHVYVCSRVRESGLLFSRIWTGEAADGPIVPLVSRACDEQPQLLRRFTDEATQCTRFDDEHEIEVKFTILDETLPWTIADALARAVQSRQLEGFIPDLGNETQRWTYGQHTYEVLSPPDRRGYIGFMTAHDGTFAVKFKFYEKDSLRRYERVVEGVRLDPSEFRSYISSDIGDAELRELPYLTRTRFDVNVESAMAGHFFGLEMDEVQSGGRVMRQLEIEYHRSRACYGVDAGTIEPELFRLADQVEDLFTAWGIAAERGYLSKLSFLKNGHGALALRSDSRR
jgi:hypothetical protein